MKFASSYMAGDVFAVLFMHLGICGFSALLMVFSSVVLSMGKKRAPQFVLPKKLLISVSWFCWLLVVISIFSVSQWTYWLILPFTLLMGVVLFVIIMRFIEPVLQIVISER